MWGCPGTGGGASRIVSIASGFPGRAPRRWWWRGGWWFITIGSRDLSHRGFVAVSNQAIKKFTSSFICGQHFSHFTNIQFIMYAKLS